MFKKNIENFSQSEKGTEIEFHNFDFTTRFNQSSNPPIRKLLNEFVNFVVANTISSKKIKRDTNGIIHKKKVKVK
jgi:hypothetical protein